MLTQQNLQVFFLNNHDLFENAFYIISALSIGDYYSVGYYTGQILIGIGGLTMTSAADELTITRDVIPPENTTTNYTINYKRDDISVRDISVPANWTCPPLFYSSFDGCDCGCGVHDPDCDRAHQILYNCYANSSAYCSYNGVCNYGPTAPLGWTCNISYYNSTDGCINSFFKYTIDHFL